VKLAIFTDEINREDPERALKLAREWGIDFVEVRSLVTGRFPSVPDEEIEEFRAMIQDVGLRVSGVSPGISKKQVDSPSLEADITAGLQRACEWARRLDTDVVSGFGFRRAEGEDRPSQVVDHFARMADIARQNGCRLVLENEAVCWGATGIEAAEIIREADSDNLSLCWDPGNSAKAGSRSPYPDEYEQIKDLVTHVHMKNFGADTGVWQLIEDGVVDWPGQIAALKADGYDGFMIVETHTSISAEEFEVVDHDLAGLEANSLRNVEYARSLIG
jgi:sugar phosphate isomerase/epimerase